jgi:hypothetical protein
LRDETLHPRRRFFLCLYEAFPLHKVFDEVHHLFCIRLRVHGHHRPELLLELGGGRHGCASRRQATATKMADHTSLLEL